jgi:hypothetical protein
MTFSEQDKQEVLQRLGSGDRRGAIDYLKRTLSVGENEAVQLVTALESESQRSAQPASPPPSATAAAGCAGCLSGVFKLGGIFFFVFSLLFFGLAGVMHYLGERELEDLQPVNVTINESYNEDSTYVDKTMVYEWQGQTFTMHTSGSIDSLQVGDTTSVMLDPNDPSSPLLPEDLWQNFMYAFLGAGVFMLFISIFLWTFGRLFKPKPHT